MREIKFRAWDGERYLYLENADFEISYCGVQLYAEFGGSRIIECDLEQFTGLRDKNGKEIYEGDIVEYGRVDGNHVLGAVVYNAPTFIAEPDYDKYSCSPIELAGYEMYYVKIIGNIHENQELLK